MLSLSEWNCIGSRNTNLERGGNNNQFALSNKTFHFSRKAFINPKSSLKNRALIKCKLSQSTTKKYKGQALKKNLVFTNTPTPGFHIKEA